MRFNTLFVVVALSCLCLAVTQGFYDDCCLKYVKEIKPNSQKHVMSYKLQNTDGGCNIPAVIFSMRKGRKLCGNPSEKWVKALTYKIDIKKNQKNRSQNRG